MEVSALTHASTAPGLRGPSPLLRFQPDEKLVALTRRGHHAAFEVLCARYQSRLLSFVRHMLGSREDAEDVLQEVFAAAFNAVLADAREINVRPWLYRIARNRSLNHLRRASAVGVDSMDVHFADYGLSTGDRVLRRESFRELLADVQQLPETQRTALLLREIDALSYEQIAQAMETTVPSVKSLLVRARISLAEAAEARKLSCAEVRLELGEVAEGLVSLSAPARRHVRGCARCRGFKRQLKDNNRALAMLLPVGPLLIAKKLLFAKLGSTASASSAHVASGAGATVGGGAAASAGAAGGASAGGVFTVGAGALASKAVAGLAAAAIVSAGAVAANQGGHSRHHNAAAHRTAFVPAESHAYVPVVERELPQPLSATAQRSAAVAARVVRARRLRLVKRPAAPATAIATLPATPAVPAALAAPTVPPTTTPGPAAPAQPESTAPGLTQLTSEATQLPAAATAPAQPPTPAEGPAPAAPAPSAPAASAPTPAEGPAPAASAPTPAEGPAPAPASPAAPPATSASASSPHLASASATPSSPAPTPALRHHSFPPAPQRRAPRAPAASRAGSGSPRAAARSHRAGRRAR